MPIQNTSAILANNLSEELDQYVLVRTGVFNYLKFTDDEKEIFSLNGPVESKPNLVFYEENSETKIMLDYSGASDKDKKYLDILFKNLNDFSGLSFSAGQYLDEKNNIDKTFDLNLYFRQYKNNILFAKTTTTIDSSDMQKLFEADYFISTPKITSAGNWSNQTSQTNSLLISVNPKSSFSFSSNYYIQEGDLIEIINPNSSNNNKRYEVLQFSTINNKEVLKLKTKATNENLLGSSTVVNIYAKTKRKERASTTLDKTIPGCCYSYASKKYFINATEYECDVRTDSQYQFFKGTCAEFSPYEIPLPTITVNSQIIETRRLQYVLFDGMAIETLEISFEDNTILINNQRYDKFALQRGKIYKIIQNSETNLGLPIRITKNYTTVRQDIQYYYDNVFGTTNPEGIGSEIYFKVTDATVDILYLFTENKLSISPITLVVI